mmetsp:Transcript_6521/g.7340  ORF Transcript_6521/g.7340 Transcript_6521/m.7340 type:complete len:207 (-) Transcript_6521:1826-2446(-)
MFLPQRTAATIELKLSSSKMISAASRAISVPAIPIANPTSAFFKAGASLVPSPVTATTFPSSLRPVTSVYLSSGRERARTSKCSTTLANSSLLATISSLIALPVLEALFLSLGQSQTLVLQSLQMTPPTILSKSDPSMMVNSVCLAGSVIPHSLAMALAVSLLSPVTILTLMPAVLHLATAPITASLRISLIPKTAMRVNPDFSTS